MNSTWNDSLFKVFQSITIYKVQLHWDGISSTVLMQFYLPQKKLEKNTQPAFDLRHKKIEGLRVCGLNGLNWFWPHISPKKEQ